MLFTHKEFLPGAKTCAPGNNPLKELLARVVAKPVAGTLGLTACKHRYLRMDRPMEAGDFAERALQELGVGWNAVGLDRSDLPRQGALVVVSNHPFGGIEGLILIALLKRLRQDVKVLANPYLWQIPELREVLIPIDPYGTKQSRQHNVLALREGYRWLQQGGLLVVFPAGAVSHFHLSMRTVTDPPWQDGVGRLIARSQADVVPVYFPGGNGLGFQIAGLIHPRLRTLLLARQLLNKQGRMIEAHFGERIAISRLRQIGSIAEQIAYLRLRTYLLAKAKPTGRSADAVARPPAGSKHVPLATPVPAADLQLEVERLPPDCLLHQNGLRQVFCVRAEQAPVLLYEIGRLREWTFRLHGEGTGRSLDLDRFDDIYDHLFVWERQKRQIVGAYRIGQTDHLLSQYGVQGLYSGSLFKINPRLFTEIPPALELGRSFVRPEYQKNFSSLLLLWQGIGGYLVRNPRYRILFGPVSISRAYSDFSRQMMTLTLQDHLGCPDLSRYVAPRIPVSTSPPQVKGCKSATAKAFTRNIETMSALVADIDSDLKGVPVLLRHYLNLGGKMLAFNRDPAFSDVIDGLIMVNLEQTELKTLQRYMGKTGAEAFLSHNQQHNPLTPRQPPGRQTSRIIMASRETVQGWKKQGSCKI